TRYGQRLEDILLALGRWGSAMLAEPRPEDIVTEDSLMIAMRASFLRDAAVGPSGRDEMPFGDSTIAVVVEDGHLEAGPGPLAGAPVIEPGPTMKEMLTRALSVEDAMGSGLIGRVDGGAETLREFLSMFGLPYQPVPQRSLV